MLLIPRAELSAVSRQDDWSEARLIEVVDGDKMQSNANWILQRLLALILAISVAMSGIINAHAASAFGPQPAPLASQPYSTEVRFISPDTMDPTIPGVGTNRYSYSQNDPVNKSDPSGHLCIPCGILAIGVLTSWLSGTTEANAPGLEEGIESTTEGEAIANMAIGAVPGAAAEKLAARTFGRVSSQISVWAMGTATRGFAIEKKLGGNLAHNFRTIDFWDPNSGVAKSIKSINLQSRRYNDPKILERQLKSYVSKMEKFTGATGRDQFGNPITVTQKSIKKKQIEIAIPGKPTKEQQRVIENVKAEGNKSGVDVSTTVVKNLSTNPIK